MTEQCLFGIEVFKFGVNFVLKTQILQPPKGVSVYWTNDP